MTREPVGNDWLQDFRDRFADEFPAPSKPPIETIAQRAVEANVAADRSKQNRFGEKACA